MARQEHNLWAFKFVTEDDQYIGTLITLGSDYEAAKRVIKKCLKSTKMDKQFDDESALEWITQELFKANIHTMNILAVPLTEYHINGGGVY